MIGQGVIPPATESLAHPPAGQLQGQSRGYGGEYHPFAHLDYLISNLLWTGKLGVAFVSPLVISDVTWPVVVEEGRGGGQEDEAPSNC